ncbi:MAG: fumarate hydratase C-terminal domain-containing protein [Actinobacteria bacterium]|nr:fumarate hydratase C-terminal domain-containing protein [Actinomycetota bacterium]
MKNQLIKLETPLTVEKIENLRAGDMVYLSGTIYSARDIAHKRMVAAISRSEKLPFDLEDNTIFYAGPSPTPPGKKSGGIGPTTSARMDSLTEPLLEKGLRAMIGKGNRSQQLKELLHKYKAVYFVALGGVAAYLSTKVESIKPVAYEDLGPEAVHELKVRDFPLFVACDIHGGDIFKEPFNC